MALSRSFKFWAWVCALYQSSSGWHTVSSQEVSVMIILCIVKRNLLFQKRVLWRILSPSSSVLFSDGNHPWPFGVFLSGIFFIDSHTSSFYIMPSSRVKELGTPMLPSRHCLSQSFWPFYCVDEKLLLVRQEIVLNVYLFPRFPFLRLSSLYPSHVFFQVVFFFFIWNRSMDIVQATLCFAQVVSFYLSFVFFNCLLS